MVHLLLTDSKWKNRLKVEILYLNQLDSLDYLQRAMLSGLMTMHSLLLRMKWMNLAMLVLLCLFICFNSWKNFRKFQVDA